METIPAITAPAISTAAAAIMIIYVAADTFPVAGFTEAKNVNGMEIISFPIVLYYYITFFSEFQQLLRKYGKINFMAV